MSGGTGRAVRVNGTVRAVAAGTIEALLREMGHDPARPGLAVALDGRVVPRGEWAERRLHDGATIEIVGAVQGG
jgi:sulfur carrier protein